MDKHLKGKLVVINFWTYCCINCLHVLPDLEYLEQKFHEESSIIFLGCHSAKFLNERDSNKVRDAILKYEIKHPVINDDRLVLWKSYERRSWPSQVIISPKSQIPILILHGEGMRQVMDLFISVAYDFYYDSLNHSPTVVFQPEE
jgi:thiol-disulfide isomerase/thioredoxin